MKHYRRIIGLITAATLSTSLLTACGAEEDAEGVQFEKLQEDAEAKETDDSAKDNDASGEQEEQDAKEAAGSSEDSENNGPTGDLYLDFQNGNAKAKFTGEGEVSGYINLSEVLTEGDSYTMDEIYNAIDTLGEFADEPDIAYTMIDCGSDGNKELFVDAQLSAEFSLWMIIKDIDGEPVICFSEIGGGRWITEVNMDGTIQSSGASAANIHNWDYAMVDADGKYVFFYGASETLSVVSDTYDIYKGDTVTNISTEGIDADHMAVVEYYFEQDYEKRDYFYSFYTFDDSFEKVVTDKGNEEIATFAGRFEDAGFKTYTDDEISGVLSQRASEIGYPYN